MRLSVEVRHGGVDILADPGTYCYHGEPEWRSYFQSTIGHNTVEIDGQWQSARGGAFLWLRHAHGREIEFTDDGSAERWTATHDGYRALRPSAAHQRSVLLDRGTRVLEIIDEVDGGGFAIRLAFHLGPAVHAELDGTVAELSWPEAVMPGAARLVLPGALRWDMHRGATDPILGWYSRGLGHRVPTGTLVGTGLSAPGVKLITRLEFGDAAAHRQAVSWGESGETPDLGPEIQVEATG